MGDFRKTAWEGIERGGAATSRGVDAMSRPFDWAHEKAHWLLGAWLVAWLLLGRHQMLDDALIHLRFAENLERTGTITYDGVSPGYGTSSLLFVGILALLRGVSDSWLVPKWASLIAYLAALAWLVTQARRQRSIGLAWTAVAIALSGPLAIRWLTDGMETSSIVAASIAAPALFQRGAVGRPWARALLVGCTAALTVWLRVELSLMVAVVALGAALISGVNRATLLGLLLPAAAGTATALAAIWFATGHLLPDTAVAKAAGASHGVNGFVLIGATLAGSGSFGLGLLAVWMLSTWHACANQRTQPQILRATLLVATLFPVLCLVAMVRGQSVAIRYLVWPLICSTTFNLCLLDARDAGGSLRSFGQRSWLALAAGLVLSWSLEATAVHRIFAGRSATFERLSRTDFSAIHRHRAVAADIGAFGYFSRTLICDVAGLVNGRAFAAMTAVERLRACAETRPDVAFLTVSQARALEPWLDLRNWQNCGSVEFTNVRETESHRLLLAPSATLTCPRGFEQ